MKPDNSTRDALFALLDGLARPAEMKAQEASAVRAKLFDRVGRALRAGEAFVTVRRHQWRQDRPAPGVRVQQLYRSGSGAAARSGEPLNVMLIELDAGAAWSVAPAAGPVQREWLVMRGQAHIGADDLPPYTYQVGGGAQPQALSSATGARLYLRESALVAPALGLTQQDSPALWHDFAPGIRRRLLWSRGTEAAMLYRAEPGAAVPSHSHGHDEECLMLEGEVFVDDILLREGEYQIAPAGTGHSGVFTDTGALLYAHGDLELDVRAA